MQVLTSAPLFDRHVHRLGPVVSSGDAWLVMHGERARRYELYRRNAPDSPLSYRHRGRRSATRAAHNELSHQGTRALALELWSVAPEL